MTYLPKLPTLLVALSALLGRAHAADEINSNGRRLFAYMKARNVDGSKQRTHVYALTTTGTIAQRFVDAVNRWREESTAFRYENRLSFPSPKERTKRVVLLREAIDEFNRLAHQFFRRRGHTTAPADHLMVMRQKFGPDYASNNQNLPTRDELNSLHEQFAILSGPGAVDPISSVWGNWTEHLHDELVQYLGYSADQVEQLNVGMFNAHNIEDKGIWQHDDAIVLRMYDLLEDINVLIHATENMIPWTVRNRFAFNTLKLGKALKHELFHDEDFDPAFWRMAMEMGGLYMAYAKTGKNLYALMIDDDIKSLKNHAKLNTIQFQEGFNPGLYSVWTLGNETEVEKRRNFADWWKENDVSQYGFEWNKRSEPNGFIRLGQQICDPPTDCDRAWVYLIDEFSETPLVDDIIFSDQRPYGFNDADLRFLYPGDEQILAEREARTWALPSWGMTMDDLKVWWYSKLAPSLPWPMSSASNVASSSTTSPEL